MSSLGSFGGDSRIAPDISHPTEWKLKIILVPLGTLPRPRGGGISMRLRDMWIRVVASVRALLPCTLYLGSKEMINIIESNLMIFHDNVDFQLWITSRSFVFVVVTCFFSCPLAMQMHVVFFQRSETVWPKLPASLQEVWGCWYFATFFFSTFSQYHSISWTSSVSRLWVCISPIVFQNEASQFCQAAAGCFFSSRVSNSVQNFWWNDGFYPNLGWGAMACRCLWLSGAAKKPRQGGATCQVLCLLTRDVMLVWRMKRYEKVTCFRYSCCRPFKVSFLQWILCFFLEK